MKRKIKLFIHKLQWRYDQADPAMVGFWFCMIGLLFTEVLFFLIS